MSDNTEKSNRGRSGQVNLGDLIVSLQEKQYIASFVPEYRDGYKGFDRKQFYYQYLIQFTNDDCWILHSTTSIRSDRMNIQQWNAEHLKRLNGYIKKAYVVYPNGLSEKEQKNADNYQQKLLNSKQYSAVDGVVSQSELYSLVENKALDLMGNKGSALAKRGNNFELWLTEIMNSSENFQKWKTDDTIRTGFFYDIFEKMLEQIDLVKSQVVSVNATNDIPKLPSGGKAKTDLLLTVDTYDGELVFTYSCKKSSSDWVSVHEYNAAQFVDVLNISDGELENALNDFQSKGSIEKMDPNAREVISKRLHYYNTSLNEWVLGGVGGAGDPETQWARKIITYDDRNSNITIEDIEDYIIKATKDGAPGNFGTMFRWTYPSGGLGKRIQLKMKVI